MTDGRDVRPAPRGPDSTSWCLMPQELRGSPEPSGMMKARKDTPLSSSLETETLAQSRVGTLTPCPVSS